MNTRPPSFPIILASPPPVKLQLARDRVASLRKGHPWVFADYLVSLPSAPPGSLAILKDRSGDVIAQGIYDPSSHLAFRACSLNPERFTDDVAFERLNLAWSRRRSCINSCTNAYRLINGEGDRLPGLICDVYDSHAVIQLDGAGPTGFWNIDAIASALIGMGAPSSFYRKSRSGEPKGWSRVISGEPPPEALDILEHGLTFEANLIHGQKTAFFLDQRDNRLRVRSWAKDRSVLNLFGYTGGFSVYAGAGGARDVTTVDSAKAAVETAHRNWIKNGFEPDKHLSVAEDAFEFLERAKEEKKVWDLVIVDPPSFAPGKHHIDKARNAYVSVLISSLQVTAPSGIFAASSCSSHIDPAMFLDICQEAVSKARRRATVLGIYGQPEDHPFPLACQELQYLKFVLLCIE